MQQIARGGGGWLMSGERLKWLVFVPVLLLIL